MFNTRHQNICMLTPLLAERYLIVMFLINGSQTSIFMITMSGALITVNYEAGPMGYSETREEKLGFVEIRSKPARVAPAPAKVDQATLIQRILAILQPQIGSAVSSAIEVRYIV